MTLYKMRDGQIDSVQPTTFVAEKVLERQHLQKALLTNPALLGDDLLVLAEEYGEWTDARRRIDLLCLDKRGQLVVVEIKRTDDGGHMELQALRYAAMVSLLSEDHIRRALRAHLERSGQDPDAEQRLADWLADNDVDEESIPVGEPRIVLVSAGFDKEITSTVLWLNRLSDIDIRCVKVSPYKLGDDILLDVQQLIPLPEATEYMVQLRQKEQATKVAQASSKDFTKYRIVASTGVATEPLAKKRAVLAMVQHLHAEGVAGEVIRTVLPDSKFAVVDGELTGESLATAFAAAYPGRDTTRWYLDQPLHGDDRTWVLFTNWGQKTQPTLAALADLSSNGLTFVAVPSDQ